MLFVSYVHADDKQSLIGYLFGHLKDKLSSPFGLVRLAMTYLAMSLSVGQRPVILLPYFLLFRAEC